MRQVGSWEEKYRTVAARDRRFDGQFITAVRSTGIYCRPSCPARTPKRENVSFFVTSAAAQEAGFRACKRCLPEAVPGSPEWDIRGDVAGRAMRLIVSGTVEREGVPGLAAALGYSPRHLTRLLKQEWGAGPIALARAHRAQTARTLLSQTSLPITETAFAAGFTSVRQFNETIRLVYGMTPREIRTRRQHLPESVPGALTVELPYRLPLAVAPLFSWFAQRAIPGMEVGTANSLARVVRLPGGISAISVTAEVPGRLRVDLSLAALGDLPLALSLVRRSFDLDADPTAIDEALSVHPLLRAAVAATPGLRVPGTFAAEELLIRTMVGQQISVAAARGHLGRLVDTLGTAVSLGPGLTRAFPSLSLIAERGAEVLRGPAARIRAIVEVAGALAEGQLEVSAGAASSDLRTRLLACRGIGPWTADYACTRIVGDPDVFLPGDSGVRAGAKALGLPDSPRELATWAERTAPWRSYLNAHLWQAVSLPPPGDSEDSALSKASN